MTRLVNRLRYRSTLLKSVETVDEDDRPVIAYEPVRTLNYADIGVTASDKYMSQQAKTDVVRKIRCRLDKTVTQKNFRVQIGATVFLIARIYWDDENKMMELSLNYVD